jgi:hypothetical protein
MPKSWTNKSHGNTLYAYIADIKSGWADTDLTRKERRAVFMAHVLDMSGTEIAKHEACDKSAISRRLFRAIGKIVAHLNGGEFIEGDLPE